MYGTTLGGGKSHCSGGCGTIFELSPASGGGWQYDVIHLFGVDRNFGDGQGLGGSPAGGVVVDSSGNLFGTTSLGTNFQQGTVFELSPDGQGGWTGKLLNKLRQSTGGRPHAPLLLDAAERSRRGGTRCCRPLWFHCKNIPTVLVHRRVLPAMDGSSVCSHRTRSL
jgi:uncharacterized repeat protein (TIGR03803 family)